MISKVSKTEANQVNELLKKEENRFCMDCKKKSVNWISVNLGIFLCIRCAGIHRSLGSHISFVRSLALDNISEKEYQKMKEIGNENAKKIYEANVPSHVFIPNEFSESVKIEKWIKDKYVNHLYKNTFESINEWSDFTKNDSKPLDLFNFDSKQQSNFLKINIKSPTNPSKIDSKQPDLLKIDDEALDLFNFDSKPQLNLLKINIKPPPNPPSNPLKMNSKQIDLLQIDCKTPDLLKIDF